MKSPSKSKAKQTILGTYQLGLINVQVVCVWDSRDGAFYCRPDDASVPRIKVGMDFDEWASVVALLVHEAAELTMTMNNNRYNSANPWGSNHAGYIFHFDHNQFCLIADQLAGFLVLCVPDLATAYNKRHP